jgi:predicted double-glycine peptidase
MTSNQTENLQPDVFIKVPLVRQATDYSCGVAVMQSILHCFGESVREDELARELCSGAEHGTNHRNMVELLAQQGIAHETVHGMSDQQLRDALDLGQPVIIVFQAWADDPTLDYQEAWEDGHYSIVIGYNSERVFLMDPSTLGHFTHLSFSELDARWHDYDEHGRYHRMGIIITDPGLHYDPAGITHLG